MAAIRLSDWTLQNEWWCRVDSALFQASLQTVTLKRELSPKAKELVQVVEASDLDASGAPPLGGLQVTSNGEETLG